MREEDLKKLLAQMSLQEKADQMMQLMGMFYMEEQEDVLTGPLGELGLNEDNLKNTGSILGTYGADKLIKLQKEYMEKQPHHIPMLFMMDVIHGMKTIFPIPLAQGATFAPQLVKECAAVAAKEAAVSGLHVAFSPMVDLVRDARWGRVMESCGEDPYLNGLMAAAQVQGFQGEDMKEAYKLCACIKHFAAYGGAEAGRDYNTVELSEHTFRDFYLKAYQAGIDAGAGMVMTSFNTVNGIPATTNRWLMRTILRDEMGFDGVLISDFSAIMETIAHGYSEDARDATKKAIEAGVDIDMMTSFYAKNIVDLVKKGEIKESLVEEAVLRILQLKNKLGLFEKPFKDANPTQENALMLCKEHRALARKVAAKSFVLLKNEGLLPLEKEKKLAFIGPYVNRKEILSSWAVTGDSKDSVTIEEAAKEVLNQQTVYCQGAPILDEGVELEGMSDEDSQWTSKEQKELLQQAIEAAKNADTVVLALGEHYLQTGEAASRAMLDLPQCQMELLREVSKVNDNIVVVLFNGRPLDLREVSRLAKSVLEVWLPGTEGGHAILDVLTGKENPSGKLPMSFPYSVGQVPVYYNHYETGRPASPEMKTKYRSKYLDIPNEPLYPFGYGLSYTEFEISPVALSAEKMDSSHSQTASVKVKNIGSREGTQTLQLYIRDVSASVVRPVKELKGFEQVTLKPGEEKQVVFTIDEAMLQFIKADGTIGSEAGKFHVWIGQDSSTENQASFSLQA